MEKNEKIIEGKIIGAERFDGKNKQVLQVSIKELPYEEFKEFIFKEPKVKIKILE